MRGAFPTLMPPAVENDWSTEKIQAMLAELIETGDRVTSNAATYDRAGQSGVSTAFSTATFPPHHAPESVSAGTESPRSRLHVSIPAIKTSTANSPATTQAQTANKPGYSTWADLASAASTSTAGIPPPLSSNTITNSTAPTHTQTGSPPTQSTWADLTRAASTSTVSTATFPRTNNNQAQAVAAKIATGSRPRLARDASTPYAGITSSLESSNADMATSPTTGEIPILLDLSWRAPPAASRTVVASAAGGYTTTPGLVSSPDQGHVARKAGVLGWESDGESVGEGEMEEEGSRSGESKDEEASRSEEGSNSEESSSGQHSSVHAGDGLHAEQDRRSWASTEQHRASGGTLTGHDDDDRVSSSFAFPSSSSHNGTNDDGRAPRPARPISALATLDASTRIPGDVWPVFDVDPDTQAHAYGGADGGDGMSFFE